MENKKSFDKKISQIKDVVRNWKNKKNFVKKEPVKPQSVKRVSAKPQRVSEKTQNVKKETEQSPELIKKFSDKIKEIYSKKRVTPAVIVKNYNNIFEKAKFYAEQMKKIVEDAELSTHEKKDQVKVYVIGLVDDLKKDVKIIGVKVNTNIKNVEYSKFLKLLPYILIAIGALILANPVLLNVLIKSVAMAFSSGGIFTQAGISAFLTQFGVLFSNLQTIEKILLVVSFLSMTLEEIPRFLSKSNYEKTVTGNSLLALTKRGLSDIVSSQNRLKKMP